MAEIHHEIKIDAPTQRVFDALSSREGLKGWHATAATGSGAVGTEWTFTHDDGPEFAWHIHKSEAPQRIEWRCTKGPGDSVGTTVTFTISDTDDGRTLVEHVHAGWPGAHGNFRKCNTLWAVLLHRLRQHVENPSAH